MTTAAPIAAVALALALAGCAPPRVAPPGPARAEAAPPERPARWLFTDRLGVLFDDAQGALPGGARVEPAILDGVRAIVDAGAIVGSARHADRFTGFRSLPPRLGGGFVLWSEDRVYRAASFLDEPRPIVDLGATSARPWLGSVLLRTPSGMLDLDPASLAIRRVPWPGVADAFALDARRAVIVDVLGRGRLTTDGGATWTDLLAARGARLTGVREHDGALLLNMSTSEELTLGAAGDLRIAPRATSAPHEARPATPLLEWPTTTRALASDAVAAAIAWGAPLPGRRALVTRENGARVVALETGLTIADAALPSIDERFQRCQAVAAGAPPRPLLACATEHGGAVIAIDGSLASLSLEATFPRRPAGFLVGPRGRLAFDGPCGPAEPRATDLGATKSEEPSEPADPGAATGADTPAPADDARVCVRGTSGSWFERRLEGDDARHLYRWVTGDDGAVTALILKGAAEPPPGDDDEPSKKPAPTKPEAPAAPAKPPEGVRVIRLDPDDAALGGGAFPALPTPQRGSPQHTADGDFWQDDDGSIRGWIKLPAEGEQKVEAPPVEHGSGRRMLRVASERGGRTAGVRIDAAGRVTVLALPEGTAEVVAGGRFALAMALRDGVPSWFESTDGGARWAPIEGPPAGRLDAPGDESVPHGCSALGCAAANGLVRLGWGGPSPTPPPDLALAPAVSPKLRDPAVPRLRCRLDGAPPWAGPEPVKKDGPAPAKKEEAPAAAPPPAKKGEAKKGEAKKKSEPKKGEVKKGEAKKGEAKKGAPPAPIALRLPVSILGELHDHTFTAEVVMPFQPLAAPRRVSASDRAITGNRGKLIPLLTSKARDPIDLLLALGDRRIRAGGPTTPLPLPTGTTFGVAVELAGGALALLDVDRDQVVLARGAAVSPIVHLTRVQDAARARITLAQRPSGGLAVLGWAASSGEVFAGDLDLDRAEVGPLAALGRTDTIVGAAACSGSPTHRALIELPIDVQLETPAGVKHDRKVTASILIAAGPDRLCAEAVEAALPDGPATVLSAVLGKGAAASVRSGDRRVAATCSLAKP